jgi:hypothetical protein
MSSAGLVSLEEPVFSKSGQLEKQNQLVRERMVAELTYYLATGWVVKIVSTNAYQILVLR